MTRRHWVGLVLIVLISAGLGLWIGPRDALEPNVIHEVTRPEDQAAINRLDPIMQKIVETNPSRDMRETLPILLMTKQVSLTLTRFVEGAKRDTRTMAQFEVSRSGGQLVPSFSVFPDVIENPDIDFLEKQLVFFHEYCHLKFYQSGKYPKEEFERKKGPPANWRTETRMAFESEVFAHSETFNLMDQIGFTVAMAEKPTSLFRDMYIHWKTNGMNYVRRMVAENIRTVPRAAYLNPTGELNKYLDELIKE